MSLINKIRKFNLQYQIHIKNSKEHYTTSSSSSASHPPPNNYTTNPRSASSSSNPNSISSLNSSSSSVNQMVEFEKPKTPSRAGSRTPSRAPSRASSINHKHQAPSHAVINEELSNLKLNKSSKNLPQILPKYRKHLHLHLTISNLQLQQVLLILQHHKSLLQTCWADLRQLHPQIT